MVHSKMFKICVPLLLTYFHLSSALDYQTIEDLESFVKCPLTSSCERMRDIPGNKSFTNCECDSACIRYDDCCVDGPRRSSTTRRTKLKVVCMPTSRGGFYVIGHCPTTFEGPEELRARCESDDLSDPLMSLPVTESSRRRTYLNRYCAMCHDADPLSLTEWVMSIQCHHRQAGRKRLEDMVYQRDLAKWGMYHDGEFHPCSLKFEKPNSVISPRNCIPNLVTTCPVNGNYKRECESYTLTVVVGDSNYYKNPHCALCNGHEEHEISCVSLDLLSRNRDFSFAMLLDINRSTGDIVGGTNMSSNCSSGQKYDPFSKRCRRLICGIPGYVRRGNKCVKQ